MFNITSKWGERPVPMLPACLRARWADEPIPEWVASDLSLKTGSTAAALGASLWGSSVETASPRVRNFVINLVNSRRHQIQHVEVLGRSWPQVLDARRLPWTVRTRNCLDRAGLLENPERLGGITFGELLDLSGMGVVSVIDFGCVAEAAMASLSSESETAPSSGTTVRAGLVDAIDSPWADQVSEQDPRFADLMPMGKGTVFERLDRLTGDPGVDIGQEAELALAVSRIEARAQSIGEMLLEDALSDLLGKICKLSGVRLEALAARLGWAGRSPVTLQSAASTIGVTRERIRQFHERAFRNLPKHPVYMPQLDRALEALRERAPLSFSEGAELLRSTGISRTPFHPKSVAAVAVSFHRDVGFELDLDRKRIVTDKSVEHASAIGSIARRQASASGVSNLQEVMAELSTKGIKLEETGAKHLLEAMPNLEFVEGDWFWYSDGIPTRNRLRNVTRKMLSVTAPINVGELREGIRRVYKYRNATQKRRWPLLVPPRSVLSAFYRANSEFAVDDRDNVVCVGLLHYRAELGVTEQVMVDVVRSSPSCVLERASFWRECSKRGVNESTFSTYASYSPVIRHVGADIWSLRGVRVDPAALEAVRTANSLRPREKRVLDYGWAESGSLWLAIRLPEETASFVLGVPASIRRFLADRVFVARDGIGNPSGAVRVRPDGTSFGYGAFLKRRGADANDVLVIEFCLDDDRCVLRLSDDEQFDDAISAVPV